MSTFNSEDYDSIMSEAAFTKVYQEMFHSLLSNYIYELSKNDETNTNINIYSMCLLFFEINETMMNRKDLITQFYKMYLEIYKKIENKTIKLSDLIIESDSSTDIKS